MSADRRPPRRRPLLNAPILTSLEVAILLGWSVRHFRRQVKRLEAAGFPPPIEAFGSRNRRWSRQRVVDWIDGRTPRTGEENTALQRHTETALRAVLAARARELTGEQR